jgi:DNA-binding MarR family transcriptional regulator
MYTGYLIRRAQQTHVAVWQHHVSTEFSGPQFGVMATLHRHPGSSQNLLCLELGLDRSTIAGLVARLAAKGMLSRRRDEADLRRNVLYLTEAGESTYHSVSAQVANVDRVLTERLSEKDVATLHRLLLLVIEHDQPCLPSSDARADVE